MQVLSIKYEECQSDKEKVNNVPGYPAVHFVLQGKGYYNGKEICAGQGFITLENEYAEYYPDPEYPWTYVWVRVANGELLHEYNNVFFWDIRYKEKIVNIAKDSENGSELYKLGSAYMLFSYIKNKERQLTVEQKHVLDAENYIKACYKEINTAQQVADKLGLTRAYLRNLFYAQKGMSTKEYIIRVRLEQASNMLLTDYPIKMIAFSVGYTDQLQFSRIFRKYMGMSPGEYRKKGKS